MARQRTPNTKPTAPRRPSTAAVADRAGPRPERLAAVIVLVLISLAGILGSSATAADPGACSAGGKRIVTANGVVIVYREKSNSAGGGEAYACTRKGGNLVQLDDPPSGSVAFPKPAIALSGYKLAYAVDTLDNDSEASTDVYVIDTRKPDIEAQQQGTRASTQAKIGSLVLSPTGATAWISCDVEQEGNGRIGRACSRPGASDRVYRLPPGARKPELLAKGRKIDPASLKRRAGHLSWIEDGRRKTATLD
jgi:hypothetical protein